ncbi:MAG: twin-arginine translocase TatA/TatE family subunit [Thermacetogeniaceae bacterium]|jgi:sec-independent protein translocase protein TatA
MGALEPWHLIIILAIVLIIFGPGKLPDIGKAMGKTIKEFRQASSGVTMDDLKEKTKPAQDQVAQASEQKEAPAKTS